MSEEARAIRLLAWCLLWGCIFLALAACQSLTPYVAYEHRDVSPMNGDDMGWDLGCAGIKYVGPVEAKAGWCYNVRGGDMLEARVEYNFIRRDR